MGTSTGRSGELEIGELKGWECYAFLISKLFMLVVRSFYKKWSVELIILFSTSPFSYLVEIGLWNLEFGIWN